MLKLLEITDIVLETISFPKIVCYFTGKSKEKKFWGGVCKRIIDFVGCYKKIKLKNYCLNRKIKCNLHCFSNFCVSTKTYRSCNYDIVKDFFMYR